MKLRHNILSLIDINLICSYCLGNIHQIRVYRCNTKQSYWLGEQVLHILITQCMLRSLSMCNQPMDSQKRNNRLSTQRHNKWETTKICNYPSACNSSYGWCQHNRAFLLIQLSNEDAIANGFNTCLLTLVIVFFINSLHLENY